jgi:hypothetical protein
MLLFLSPTPLTSPHPAGSPSSSFTDLAALILTRGQCIFSVDERYSHSVQLVTMKTGQEQFFSDNISHIKIPAPPPSPPVLLNCWASRGAQVGETPGPLKIFLEIIDGFIRSHIFTPGDISRTAWGLQVHSRGHDKYVSQSGNNTGGHAQLFYCPQSQFYN